MFWNNKDNENALKRIADRSIAPLNAKFMIEAFQKCKTLSLVVFEYFKLGNGGGLKILIVDYTNFGMHISAQCFKQLILWSLQTAMKNFE